MKAAAELQKAVFAALAGNAALVALTGAGKILDHAPANVDFPYISFGRASAFDWSTSTETGSEHLLTLHVWSKAKGKAETLAIMEAARVRLHDVDLPLEGHQLVNLRHEFAEVRFDDDHSVYHGQMRFRAVVEEAG